MHKQHSLKKFTLILSMLLLVLSSYMAKAQFSDVVDMDDEFEGSGGMDEAYISTLSDWKPIEVTGDAIPWELFDKTKENEICTIDQDGYDNCLIKPEYTEDMKRLHNQDVTLMGYMFPLEQADKQSTFLFGPYPLNCPFHYHVSFAQVVEVVAKDPIGFSYEPLTLKGKLSVSLNEDSGLFYVLQDAKLK